MTIIVGCMPAFAQLMKLHVGGSAFFKSLHSRLLGLTRRSGSGSNPNSGGGDGSRGSSNRIKVATIGSGEPRRRRSYYELTDMHSLVSKSQVTVPDTGPDEQEREREQLGQHQQQDWQSDTPPAANQPEAVVYSPPSAAIIRSVSISQKVRRLS